LARDYLDVTRLIRCIQQAEGNPDCFRRIIDDCQEIECCWRPYCVETDSADRTRDNREASWLNDPSLINRVGPLFR
jgi:hypothetical protein